jgi:hypothetical protein
MSIVIPRKRSKTLFITPKYYVLGRNNKDIHRLIENYEKENGKWYE